MKTARVRRFHSWPHCFEKRHLSGPKQAAIETMRTSAHRSLPAPSRLLTVLVRALAVADDGNLAVRTNKGLALLRPRK